MRISSYLTDNEVQRLLLKFYEYFENGYVFEEFLRIYLSKMELDEVAVTQRSNDGGIDLTAIRKGFGDFSSSDITYYYIQAKRYKPSKSISGKAVRELIGIPYTGKRMFITTAKYSKKAVKASKDDQRPVILIDGKSLVMSCIDRGIGFVYKPEFSESEMDLFTGRTSDNLYDDLSKCNPDNFNAIEKAISANDIRARIVRIPRSILSQIDESVFTMEVIINNKEQCNFNIDNSRTYFGGVTDFLRRYKLLSKDGVAYPKTAKWLYDVNKNRVNIYIDTGMQK